MKINSFKSDGVHEYLKFDIDFLPDLTFLIGINGSGKTSALKLILGLTSPTYNYLSPINYNFCEVVCSSTGNERNIIVRAEQNKPDNTFKMTLTLNGKVYASENMKRFSRINESHLDNDE